MVALNTNNVARFGNWKKENACGQKFPRHEHLEGCTLYPSGSTPVSKDDVKAISECLIKAALAFKPTKKGEWSKDYTW